MVVKKSSEIVLQEADTTRSFINRICKGQRTFFSHVMRREKLKHLVTTGMIEGKCHSGKWRKEMFDGLTKWLVGGQVTDTPKGSRD